MIEPDNDFRVRQSLLDEIARLGVDPTIFQTVSLEDLSQLIVKLRQITGLSAGHTARKHDVVPTLSATDCKILKVLVASTGKISSLQLSRRLGIPLSTVQRRRKKLESSFIEMSYSINVEKFGWRRVNLFISTQSGKTLPVAKELLSWEDTTILVSRIIGRPDVDLITECVVASNEELVKLIERIKNLGVKSVSWSENIEVIGYKPERFANVIEGSVKDKSKRRHRVRRLASS